MRARKQAGGLGLLRGINERAILDCLREGGAWRASELVDRTGLTRASVNTVLSSLTSKGWVSVDSPSAAGRGRPAQLYRFRQEAGFVVGIDIGAHTVRARLADLGGVVHASALGNVTPATPRDLRLDTVRRVVGQCLADASACAENVWVTVAGTTGIVDTDTGVIQEAVAIPDWTGFDLRGALRGRVPGRVYIDNDLALSAEAEIEAGTGAGMRDVVILHAGYRPGIRVFCGGEPLTGHHQVAGNLSRVNFPAGGWETMASGGDVTPGGELQALCIAAANGDQSARENLVTLTRELAGFVAVAALVIDPEAVILTGPLAEHSELVLPILRERITGICLRPPEVKASRLGADSVVVGAVSAALARLDETLIEDDATRLPPLSFPSAQS